MKKPAKAPAKKSASERSNKKAEVIALMKRAKGVTLAEIAEATGWQNHTIRGFVEHSGEQGWREDRVVEERPTASARTASRNRRLAKLPNQALLRFPPGAALLRFIVSIVSGACDGPWLATVAIFCPHGPSQDAG